MDTEIAALLYLTVFRLAIITAGIVSLVLGYRLFCRGVWPQQTQPDGTTVEAEVGGHRFTLKNAAPGTCFGLFGVVIIAVMFTVGGPEITLKSMKEEGLGGKGTATRVMTVNTIRGQSDRQEASAAPPPVTKTVSALFEEGMGLEEQGDTANAQAKYREAVTLASGPMNGLAWLYQQNGQLDAALSLAQTAVQLMPDDAGFADTLAVGSVANSELGKNHTGLHPIPGEKSTVKWLIFI